MKSPFGVSLLCSMSPMLASLSPLYAAYDALRPQDILEVGDETVIKVSENENYASRLAQKQQATTTDNRTAIVKDGQGTLVIDEDADMQCSFVVREGTTTISGATVTNLPPVESPQLTIGGSNAHLILENGATYQQYVSGGTGYVSAVSIGGRDGDGSLTLRGNSTLSVAHQLFIGIASVQELDNNNPTYGHVCGTYADSTGNVLYRDLPSSSGNFANDKASASGAHFSTGTLVANASIIKVGTGMTVGQAVIRLENGSVYSDGNRVIGDAHGVSLGDTTTGKTELNISGGSRWTSNNDFWTSLYGIGRTEITVTGENSVLEGLRETYLGYDSEAATTDLQVKDGAKVRFIQAFMGLYENTTEKVITEVSIDSSASYEGSYLKLSSGAIVKNAGQMTLVEDGQTVTAFRQDDPNTAPSQEKTYADVSAELNFSGGSLENQRTGQLNAKKVNFASGSWTNEGQALVGELSMAGGSLYQKGLLQVDSAEISQASLSFRVDDLVRSATESAYGENSATYSQITLAETDSGSFTLGDGNTVNIVFGGDLLQTGGVRVFTLDLVTGINEASLASLTTDKLGALAAKTVFSSTEPWDFSVEQYYYTAKDGILALHGIISSSLPAVPEPSRALLALAGLASLAFRRKRKS